MKKTVYVLLILLTVSCKKKQDNTPNSTAITANKVITDSAEAVSETEKPSKEIILQNLNDEILGILKSKEYAKLAEYIHPLKGVSFSMYAYVRPESDKHFSRKDFLTYVASPVKFTWGEKDGSGDIFVVSLAQYLETWVYKRDFTESEFHLNDFKGEGNSLNNLIKIYPEADFTENYIAGSEKYAFMDWNSLRLVFEVFEGKYYLIAIVNDQWTI